MAIELVQWRIELLQWRVTHLRPFRPRPIDSIAIEQAAFRYLVRGSREREQLASFQRGIIRRQIRDVLIAERSEHALHERIVALARFVVLHGLSELILALANQRRVRWHTLPVGSVAPHAGGRLDLSHLGVAGRLCDAKAQNECKSRD